MNAPYKSAIPPGIGPQKNWLNKEIMAAFWESNFKDKQAMWGFDPADSAREVADLFSRHGLKKILIPGFGYGRNARPFTDHGFEVTGIEISATAIGLAKRHFGENMHVYLGSVTDMPFDQVRYDGVFCYALIHLLDAEARARLIENCYSQLRPGGYMVFVAISKNTAAYGEGTEVRKDTFLTPHGVTLFYYDGDAVEKAFGSYGLLEAREITEPARITAGKPFQTFWQVTCKKG